MAVYAAPLKRYTDATAAQLGDRSRYAATVLGGPQGRPGSARPLPEAKP
jgi:hypothetical protein